MPPERATLGQQAYRQIRQCILDGDYEPGERLVLRSLAKSLGMSLAPVGEALRQLAHEGLVDVEPRWGARVVSVDSGQLRGQHVLRMAIECEAARHCATEASAAQHQELRELALVADAPSGASEERRREMDLKFHLLVARYSGVECLYDALKINQLVCQVILRSGKHILRLMQEGTGELDPALAGRRHEVLAEAIMTRDADEAARAVRQHCLESLDWHLRPLRGT